MLSLFSLILLSLFVVIKSSNYVIRYSTRLAESFRLSKYVVGFIIVAIISILPESFISITSAVKGVPAFGLGTLFGSNVADLTLVFVFVILFAGRNLKVESKIVKNKPVYLVSMLIPIILGLNGHYSRFEGLALIVVGVLFYYLTLKDNKLDVSIKKTKFKIKDVIFLLISMGLILLGSQATVKFGIDLANVLYISPVLVGMFIVGLGTVLPELIFSIKAARHHQDSLALGDILGTVVADATVVVGVVAMICPFEFNRRIVYVTGTFMVLATFLLFYFMKSGKKITKKEAILLFVFYLFFVSVELLISQ